MSAPPETQAAAASYLDAEAVSADRRETFALRLDRFWGDLRDAVVGLHPDPAVSGPLLERLVAGAATSYAARSDDLHRLDLRRLLQPDWLQQPRMFGYACYTERFAGDLAGVAQHLDHLEDLGVTYLHLMPLLQPREGDNDGGYAVQDYRDGAARPRDRRRPGGPRDDPARARDQPRHRPGPQPCRARARLGGAGARRGPGVPRLLPRLPRPTPPRRLRADAARGVPRLRARQLHHEPDLDAWVWTTFNQWQWDLDWSNPAVLAEFAEIILSLANLGVEVLRLDAIAFLWKRMGTSCQNQPEVHAITQALHTVTRIAAPALAFKAEAIVGPRDLVQYLGSGIHAGRVSDLAYHNSLMVQTWSMLAAGNVVLAREALASLPPAPATGTWITYVRCHDDIGWAVDDGDAWSVGLTGEGHRRFLSDWYAGEAPGSWADGLVFQANPHDRRPTDQRVGRLPGRPAHGGGA